MLDFASDGKGDYSEIWNASGQDIQYNFVDQTNAGLALLAGMQLGADPRTPNSNTPTSSNSNAPNSSNSNNPNSSNSSAPTSSHVNVWPTVGGVAAGVLVVTSLLILLIRKWYRKRGEKPSSGITEFLDLTDARYLYQEANPESYSSSRRSFVSIFDADTLVAEPVVTNANPQPHNEKLSADVLSCIANSPTKDLTGLSIHHIQSDVADDGSSWENETLPDYRTEFTGTQS